MAKSRDYNQYYYADGISRAKRRSNPRAVSNAFFKRRDTLLRAYALASRACRVHHATSPGPRLEPSSSTSHARKMRKIFTPTPFIRVLEDGGYPRDRYVRENPARTSTGRRPGSIYHRFMAAHGMLREACAASKKGKLLTQELQTRGAPVKNASYLPFNTMNVPTRTRPGVNQTKLFAGGDPRTNEGWIMMSVHALFLQEAQSVMRTCSQKAASGVRR